MTKDIEFSQLEESLIDRQVEEQVKVEQAKKKGELKTVDQLKPMTTKELTKQLAIALHHIDEMDSMINIIMQQQSNIDAAAYLACASLDRRGNLFGIKKLDRKLQNRLAEKIQTAKQVIQEANEASNKKMMDEANRRTQEKLKEMDDERAKADQQSK